MRPLNKKLKERMTPNAVVILLLLTASQTGQPTQVHLEDNFGFSPYARSSRVH